MKKVYLDLDGVIFDFDSHFFNLFGLISKELDDSILWNKVKTHGSFFETMPAFDGAKEFVSTLKEKFDVTILTACPKTDYRSAAIQKRHAVNKLGLDVPVIPMLGGSNKCLFMNAPGDILIDDYEKNLISWKELGGIGILHTSFEQTLFELENL